MNNDDRNNIYMSFFNPQICRSLAMDNKMKRIIHGDVGLNICDACCVGRNCNEAECFALKKGNIINASKLNTTDNSK